MAAISCIVLCNLSNTNTQFEKPGRECAQGAVVWADSSGTGGRGAARDFGPHEKNLYLVSLFFLYYNFIIIRGLSGPPSIMGPQNPSPLPPLFGAPDRRVGVVAPEGVVENTFLITPSVVQGQLCNAPVKSPCQIASAPVLGFEIPFKLHRILKTPNWPIPCCTEP